MHDEHTNTQPTNRVDDTREGLCPVQRRAEGEKNEESCSFFVFVCLLLCFSTYFRPILPRGARERKYAHVRKTVCSVWDRGSRPVEASWGVECGEGVACRRRTTVLPREGLLNPVVLCRARLEVRAVDREADYGSHSPSSKSGEGSRQSSTSPLVTHWSRCFLDRCFFVCFVCLVLFCFVCCLTDQV